MIDPDPPAVCLITDTVLAHQLPRWPAGYAHVRVFTPTHRYQRPVIIIGEPVDNPGPPIMTVITKVIEMVRADFLPYHHRAPRVLAYHPDPKGTGWFSTVRMRRWMPAPGLLPWGRLITHAKAEHMTGCPLATPLATSYTVAVLRTRRYQ
jgi:hypothetical protein